MVTQNSKTKESLNIQVMNLLPRILKSGENRNLRTSETGKLWQYNLHSHTGYAAVTCYFQHLFTSMAGIRMVIAV